MLFPRARDLFWFRILKQKLLHDHDQENSLPDIYHALGLIILSAYLRHSTKELLDKVIVNLTPVRVAHSRRKGAKKTLDYRLNLGDWLRLEAPTYWCVRQDLDFGSEPHRPEARSV
jgi:hypothetical protein